MIPDRSTSGSKRVSTRKRPRRDSEEAAGSDLRSVPVDTIHRSVGNQGVQSMVEDGSSDRAVHDRSASVYETGSPGTTGVTENMCERCVQRFQAGKPLNCEECEPSADGSDEPTVQRSVERGTLQPRLEVTDPNDEYEREAERVADEVVHDGGPQPGRIGIETGLSRSVQAVSVIQRYSSDSLAEGISGALKVGPFDTYTARQLALKAGRKAQTIAAGGLHNGPADAFRHAYWNCLMTRDIGAEQAKQVARNHEAYGSGPENENQMDRHNNKEGRKCGGSNCWSCCSGKLRSGSGELMIIPDWRGKAKQDPRPIKDVPAKQKRPGGPTPVN